MQHSQQPIVHLWQQLRHFMRVCRQTFHHLTVRQLTVRLLVVHGTVFLVLALVLDELPAWHTSEAMAIALSIGLIWWAERRWPLDTVTATLTEMDRRMGRLNAQWYGVQVRLVRPICTRQGQILLPAGTRGMIIEVRFDPGAPFAIRFDGTDIPVVPRLEKLAIVADAD